MRITGLERVRGGRGGLGAVPFFEVVPMPLATVSAGTASRSIGASPWLDKMGPNGVPGAILALADSTLGSAVLSSLDEQNVCSTVELHCNVTGLLPLTAEGISCEAEIIHSDDNSALASGYARDARGTMIAHAVQRMLISSVDTASAQSGLVERPVDDVNSRSESDPDGEGLSTIESTSPTSDLQVENTSESGVWVVVPSALHLANSVGWVHGGAIAVVANLASATATARRTATSATLRSFTIQYLRPIPALTGFACEAKMIHQGRSLAFLRVAVTTPEGQRAAVVSDSRQIR